LYRNAIENGEEFLAVRDGSPISTLSLAELPSPRNFKDDQKKGAKHLAGIRNTDFLPH